LVKGHPDHRGPRSGLGYLLLLAGLWGPSLLFIRFTVHDVPPITMVAGRMVGATALLYVLLRLRGGHLPRGRKIWGQSAVLALIGTALPFVLVGWSEQHIDSALASILNGTVPIFTLVLAHFWTKDDRLTPVKIIGVVLGLLGAVVLIVPAVEGEVRAGVLGLLACTVAALSYGASGVYARNHLRGLPPLVAPTMQFVLSAVYLVPLSLIVDRPWSIANPSPTAWGAWIALTLLGTVAAFVIYFRLLEIATASYISMATYLIPVVGVILGVTVAGERLEWNAYAGCGAILLGVLVVNGVQRRVVKTEAPEPP